MDKPASILLVDDNAENLTALSDMLTNRGYETRPVPNGKLAWRALENNPPDLIMLDIAMPEMNGYELCERIKGDERFREIPVIFLSGLSETFDKVRAFRIGAVDYITKPFHLEEVEMRVRTHIELVRQKRALVESYGKLVELEKARDDLVHMIVHDMRSLLTIILICFAQLDGEIGKDKYISMAHLSAINLADMVNSMLDMKKIEEGQMRVSSAACDLTLIARAVVSRFEPLALGKKLELKAPAEPILLSTDENIVTRVIQNLLGNALKHGRETITVSVTPLPATNAVRLSVTDDGPGIPSEFHAKIFEKFGQLDDADHKRGTGLGLAFCKMAVEALNGTLGLDSSPGKGSVFWFELPGNGSDGNAEKPEKNG